MKRFFLNGVEISDKTGFKDELGASYPIGWLSAMPESDLLGYGITVVNVQPQSKSLADLKADKNDEINKERLAANQTTFSHLGKFFACDQLSRSDIDAINGHVATRQALPPNWVGGWKAVDNSILPIQDVATWNAFYDSMIAQGQANFTKSQSLKSQLASATTAEQVAAITW